MKTVLIALNADGRSIASSETFIHSHINSIPHKTITLVGNPGFRKVVETGEELFNRSLFYKTLRWMGRKFLKLSQSDYDTAVVREFLINKKIDCVLAEYGHSGADITDACAGANIPLVVHFHGYDAYRDDILKRYTTRYRKMFKYAESVIAVSNHMKEALEKKFQVNNIIHNSCGANLSSINKEKVAPIKNQIVSVGRLTPKKGYPELIEFFSEFVKEQTDFKLLIVGDGEEKAKCEQLIQQLELQDKVILSGWAKPEDALKSIAESSCFILNSITPDNGDKEGTPVVVMEAMALGVPVVATAHGGITDLIKHNETGFLYNEHDFDGFKKALTQVFLNQERTSAIALAGQNLALAQGTAKIQNAKLVSIIDQAMLSYQLSDRS